MFTVVHQHLLRFVAMTLLMGGEEDSLGYYGILRDVLVLRGKTEISRVDRYDLIRFGKRALTDTVSFTHRHHLEK